MAVSGSVVILDSGAIMDRPCTSVPQLTGVASSAARGAPPLLNRVEVSSDRVSVLPECMAVSGSVVILDSGAVVDRPSSLDPTEGCWRPSAPSKPGGVRSCSPRGLTGVAGLKNPYGDITVPHVRGYAMGLATAGGGLPALLQGVVIDAEGWPPALA